MLHIMVMTGEIEMHAVLAEERIPIARKDRGIAVWAVRVNGMVAHDDKKRSSAWLLQLGFEPCELLGLLLGCECEVATAGFSNSAGVGHITVESDEGDKRGLSWKFEAIPACGHCPARVSDTRVLKFGIDLALRPALIVVIAENGICRTIEDRCRI